MTPKEALKGKKVYIYGRVSTEDQADSLPKQLATIRKGLKRLGFTGKAVEFQEQESGTNKDRKELKKMFEAIRNSKKDSIVVVRDFQRFTRDPVHYGALWDEFRDKGVRILSINENMVTGTAAVPEPQSDLLVPILIAAGGSEVNIRKQQTIQGVARSREKGIFAGTPLSLYPKDALEPRGELIRLMRAGESGAGIARRLSKSTSWVRKNKKQIEQILVDGGDQLLKDWLDTINLLRNLEIEKGAGTGPRATVRMKTVRRMTSGYLNNPKEFDKPTQEDIMNYFDNFNEFKKKR